MSSFFIHSSETVKSSAFAVEYYGIESGLSKSKVCLFIEIPINRKSVLLRRKHFYSEFWV